MAKAKPNPDVDGIESGQRARVVDERGAFDVAVVLYVPAACPFLLDEPRLPFGEDLAVSGRLPANGVVAQQESDGEDVPAFESRFVAARRREIHAGGFLPAADLDLVVCRAFRIKGKGGTHVVSGVK